MFQLFFYFISILMTLQSSKKSTKNYFGFSNDIVYLDFTKKDKSGNYVYVKYVMDFRWHCPACAKIPQYQEHCDYSIFSLRSYGDSYTIVCPHGHKLNTYLYLKNNNCALKHVIHIYLVHTLFATARIFIKSKAYSEDADKWLKKRQFFHLEWSPIIDTELLEVIWDMALDTYNTMVHTSSSNLLTIGDCDEKYDDFATMLEYNEGKPDKRITKFCQRMVMADGKNKYNSRPILGKEHKRMKKIKVYDKVLKRKVTILVENDAEDNPLDPWNLDNAFINMIIADYVESTQWFINRVEIQIVDVKQGTPGKNGTASGKNGTKGKKDSVTGKKESTSGKKDYRNMVEIQIVNVEQGTKGEKESTSGKKESTSGKKDSSGKNGTIKKKDSTSGKKGSTEGKNDTATGKKDSSAGSA